jgi:hypothetical protein
VKNSGGVEKKEDGGGKEKLMGNIRATCPETSVSMSLARCLHCLNTALNTTHPLSLPAPTWVSKEKKCHRFYF